jgi:hypothetical protein
MNTWLARPVSEIRKTGLKSLSPGLPSPFLRKIPHDDAAPFFRQLLDVKKVEVCARAIPVHAFRRMLRRASQNDQSPLMRILFLNLAS